MPNVPTIPGNAPFTDSQRLWLNGFLAGLFAAEAGGLPAEAGVPGAAGRTPLLILYGSQTGTAEALARQLAAKAKARGFPARVLEAAAGPSVAWKNEGRLLLVTSTYGDGEPPDNARGLWDWLQTDAARSLAHLEYSVLALGDTRYEHFCAAGKRMDARLEELGAKRVHPLAECDVDYEGPARAWMEGVLGALDGAGQKKEEAKRGPRLDSALVGPGLPEGYSRANPFPARLLANRKLTGEGSGKEVRHFELGLEASGLVYEVGDALGVCPANCPGLVEELLGALRCDGEEAVPAPGGGLPAEAGGPGGGEVSLRKALQELYDITRPAPGLLQRAAEGNGALKELLAPERQAELRKWLWGREIIDLFLETPGLGFTPADFVGLLKPLAPRLYSISSSPKIHAGQVHLTVNIVRHASFGRVRKGVCSSFLAERAGGQTPVPVFVQPSAGFRLPDAPDTPIIMVGPGTGVAPFRAFLHERQATGAKGRNWLFFGEQRAETDYYYREELEPMLASGHLTRLSTAFSRDQADKVYVQHRMLEEAAELWAWLKEGAHFYVCGDATRMAKDVEAALHRVIETAGGMSAEAAAEQVQRMRAEKRYQRDVY